MLLGICERSCLPRRCHTLALGTYDERINGRLGLQRRGVSVARVDLGYRLSYPGLGSYPGAQPASAPCPNPSHTPSYPTHLCPKTHSAGPCLRLFITQAASAAPKNGGGSRLRGLPVRVQRPMHTAYRYVQSHRPPISNQQARLDAIPCSALPTAPIDLSLLLSPQQHRPLRSVVVPVQNAQHVVPGLLMNQLHGVADPCCCVCCSITMIALKCIELGPTLCHMFPRPTIGQAAKSASQ
ncbi:hypothetical protein EV126DRAFT_247917 [Verticillium dahliae]|nr:hypothetical protein EV126DRAFT_247917 [Verticillium dahliae]